MAAVCAGSFAESGENEVNIPIEKVEVNGFSMDYFRFGHGPKTLVILPGLSVESVMKFAPSVANSYASLTEDFTIYVPDRRKELPATYSLHEMAHDTAAALQALGLDQVCLFGASQGGMIAMVVAIEHPELVVRLALGSTSACMDGEAEKVIENWISLAKQGNAEELYLAFGEAIYPSAVFEQARDLLVESAKAVTEADLVRFAILAETIEGFDVSDLLHRIECPVLVLGSGDDRVLGGEASEKIAEQLKNSPDCELVMYEGYGHAAYDLAPDYRERLKTFFLKGTER